MNHALERQNHGMADHAGKHLALRVSAVLVDGRAGVATRVVVRSPVGRSAVIGIPHDEGSQRWPIGRRWKRVGPLGVWMRCPDCGELASLEDHTIADDGTVTPSVVCPFCSFHESVTLDGYEPK